MKAIDIITTTLDRDIRVSRADLITAYHRFKNRVCKASPEFRINTGSDQAKINAFLESIMAELGQSRRPTLRIKASAWSLLHDHDLADKIGDELRQVPEIPSEKKLP